METQMAETKKDTTSKIELLLAQELKPKQSVIDLKTGGEVDLQLTYKKYTVNSKADKKAVLAQLEKMVSPEDQKISAYVDFLNRKEYADAKNAALETGDYMSSQLRSTLTGMMQNLPAFSDTSAKECYERWMAGFKAGKDSAKKLLDRARAAIEGSEFSDL